VSWHYQLTKICHLSWKSSYFFNGQLLSVNFKHVWFLSADFREIRSCDWFIIAWLNTDGWLDWWDVCLVTIVRYLTVRYFVLWRIRHVTATCRWRNQPIKTVCVTWNIGSQKLANFCRPTVWADFYPSCVIGYRMFYKPSVFRCGFGGETVGDFDICGSLSQPSHWYNFTNIQIIELCQFTWLPCCVHLQKIFWLQYRVIKCLMLIYREQLQRLLTIISIHETHHITYFISHMVFCANAGEDGSLAFCNSW